MDITDGLDLSSNLVQDLQMVIFLNIAEIEYKLSSQNLSNGSNGTDEILS